MKIKYICEYVSIVKEYLIEQGLSKKFCRKVKLYGKMWINGLEAKNYFTLKKGDILELEYNEEENDEIKSNLDKLDIVYEDEHILVINKPIALASQPSKKHYLDNVISMCKGYFGLNNIQSNIHVCNRLDYQTSGLMVIAKDGLTHYKLTKDKVITRKYLAIINGRMENKSGLIDFPISRDENSSIKRKVSMDGKTSQTKYTVLIENDKYSLVDIELLTGRTHQIRVHFSYLGHSLVGDKLYGEEDERLYLHCYYLSFVNPYTLELIELKKISNDFNKYFDLSEIGI